MTVTFTRWMRVLASTEDSIESIYESPYMPLTDPQVRKTFYKMTLYAAPTGSMGIDVSLKFDFADAGSVQPTAVTINSTGSAVVLYGSSQAIYGTSEYGGELDNVYSSNMVGSGKVVALRVVDDSTNPTYTLDTALLEFRQNDRQ